MRRNREEDQLQRACADFLQIQENLGWLTYYHIPNGGKRSKVEAAIMKGMGMRAGAADFGLVLAPTGRAGFIELKRPGKEPTDLQNEFGSIVHAVSGYWAWCDNIDDFMAIVKQWRDLELKRGTLI